MAITTHAAQIDDFFELLYQSNVSVDPFPSGNLSYVV
jgi:hypothetical protein